MITRAITQKLSERLGQQCVADNRPGAAGGVALEMASGTLDEIVQGVVIDAGADSELVLTADEVRRLVTGQPIPLVQRWSLRLAGFLCSMYERKTNRKR